MAVCKMCLTGGSTINTGTAQAVLPRYKEAATSQRDRLNEEEIWGRFRCHRGFAVVLYKP